jgi:hypothetical protein
MAPLVEAALMRQKEMMMSKIETVTTMVDARRHVSA